MVRAGSISADPRVTKMMHSLSKNYDVLVLGWDRELSDISAIVNKRLKVKQLRLKCSYEYSLVLLLLPVFWLWVLIHLFIYRPRIVHAVDLNTVVIGYVYRSIHNCLLIFDIADRTAMFVPKRYSIINHLVDFLEESLSSKSDACTIVSRLLLNTFSRWQQKTYSIVMNCPEKMKRKYSFARTGGAHEFNIVYSGLVWRRRGLQDVASAMEDMTDVRFRIAGRVMDSFLLETLLRKSFVQYLGLQPYHKSLELESDADVLIALYDPIEPITHVASPNKFFEAMMLGVPIITNLSHLLEDVECGVLVNYGDISSIKRAIEFLKTNPAERLRLGQNGRDAFEKEYNWPIMENRLLGLYRDLERSSGA
jgi:glycosyltransferase involved in cell wall biosynthesis